jgi:hypothetical protein
VSFAIPFARTAITDPAARDPPSRTAGNISPSLVGLQLRDLARDVPHLPDADGASCWSDSVLVPFSPLTAETLPIWTSAVWGCQSSKRCTITWSVWRGHTRCSIWPLSAMSLST